MPYKDCERKEIVEEIVRRQAFRILKVVPFSCPQILGTSVIDLILGEHSLEAA